MREQEQEQMPNAQIPNPSNAADPAVRSLSSRGNSQISVEYYEEPLQIKNRGFGVTLLVFQIGFIVVYGLNGSYYSSSTLTSFIEVISVVMSGLFAILGFGLVLSVYRWGNWLGLATAVFVFGISAQLGPLLQQLWYNFLLGSYIEPTSGYIYQNSTSSISKFFDHQRAGTYSKIMLSSYVYQLVFLSCISVLTLMTAVVGRLSLVTVFKLTVVFQFLWNLNFFLHVYICVVRNGNLTLPYVFDSFGSSYVYLFAACFGIAFTVLINRQRIPSNHMRASLNGFSWIMSVIGTAFIFANFVFTSNYLLVSPTPGDHMKRFSILFALIGSVVGTFIGLALTNITNKGFLGLKQVLIGTITGGVTVGSAAAYTSNIGVLIIMGTVSGLFSGILTRPIHKKINKYYMYDTLGLFVPFLVSSLFGSLIVPSSVLAWNYFNNLPNDSIRQNPDSNIKLYPGSQMAYQLIYAGVSAGIGLGGGVLAGIFCRFDNDKFGLLANARFFINDFGLYAPQKQVKPTQNSSQSKTKLDQQN